VAAVSGAMGARLMGHFRRMDPQPDWSLVSNDPPMLGDWGRWGVSIYSDRRKPPEDMPRAEPWQDRDGEWYWRR
jgi:hypothetical protein